MVRAGFGLEIQEAGQPIGSPDCTEAMPGQSVGLALMLGFVVQFVPFSGLGCAWPQLEIQVFLRIAVCSAH